MKKLLKKYKYMSLVIGVLGFAISLSFAIYALSVKPPPISGTLDIGALDGIVCVQRKLIPGIPSSPELKCD